MDVGIVFDVFLDTFSNRARKLINLHKLLFLQFFFKDFTVQRKIFFDDNHDIFRYQFWH